MNTNEHLERLLQSVREAYAEPGALENAAEPVEPELSEDIEAMAEQSELDGVRALLAEHAAEKAAGQEEAGEDSEESSEPESDAGAEPKDEEEPEEGELHWSRIPVTGKPAPREDISGEDYVPIEQIFKDLSRKIEDGTKKVEEDDITLKAARAAQAAGAAIIIRDGQNSGRQKKKPAPRAKVMPTVGALLVSLLILFGVAFYILRADRLRAMASIKPLEVAANAYSMSYDGSYGLSGFVNAGGAANDEELMEYLSQQFSGGRVDMPVPVGSDEQGTDNAITALNSKRGYEAITGRSYHCSEELMTMVVTTWSSSGIESVSTVNLNWLGYTPYNRPEGLNRYAALAAIYLPLDGMNSDGLVAAALEVPGEAGMAEDTERRDLTATCAVRLLLDWAEDVDTALELLSNYDVFPSCGKNYNLFISDSTGRSVLVAWAKGQMVVVESVCGANTSPGTPGREEALGDEDSARRVDSLSAAFSKYDGYMTKSQITNAIQHVTPDGDGWMVVYDAGTLSAEFFFDGDFERQFAVCMKG